MPIRQISLNDFRNLKPVTLDLHPSLNILYGPNASGKTSFLEALYILCQGQSFRSSSLVQCLQHDKSSFLLFSYFNKYKVGISRSEKLTTIRLNGETIHKVSSLAEKTPVRIIHANTLNLVIGSPSDKREYIDWCLFHVEHKYHQLWTDFNHALKQRNALLKLKKNLIQLDYWDNYICSLNQSIYELRIKCIDAIKINLNSILKTTKIELNLDINYKPGWDTQKSLKEVLLSNRSRDIKYGFTRFGIHRDDIIITTDGHPVQHVLSRGQIKSLSIMMVLSKILLISQLTEKSTILLIDDMESELDHVTLQNLLNLLSNFNIQVFISFIRIPDQLLTEQQEYKMFHVEHGIIKPVKNI